MPIKHLFMTAHRRRTTTWTLFLALSAVAGTLAAQTPSGELPTGEPAPMGVPVNEYDSDLVHEAFGARVPSARPARAEPPAPQAVGLAAAFQDGVNLHTLAPLTAEEIAAADREFEESPYNRGPGSSRTGVVRNSEPLPMSAKDGFVAVMDLADGRKLWTCAIRSPDAYGLRVHFTSFDLGGASLIVYAPGSEQLIVRGPYGESGPNRTGDFWTPSLPGDTVFIEFVGALAPRLQIAEIVHFDRDPAGTDDHSGDDPPGGRVLPCHLDVMCHSDPPVSALARDATGKINLVPGGFATWCTGTLLNDLDNETWAPYFLTAYHCLNTQAAVDTIEVVWGWQNQCDDPPLDCPTSCGGTLPDYFSLPRNISGTLLETNPEEGGNDMSFIRLDGELPGGATLAGWTTGHPDSAVGIHHPGTGAGSWKRVVFLSDSGACPGCEFCGDGTDYDYYDMAQNQGLVEGGSSGSGVFNYQGQLAGQLLGTCCVVPACADDVYDCNEYDEYAAQYGEFETTYPIIRRWLEIGGTIHVDGSYSGPKEGTPAEPFNTVNEANGFAWNGARIKIQSGSYPETLTFSKQLTVLADAGTVTIGQ